jgi:hypothetical protein
LEASDFADQIREVAEEKRDSNDRFRARAAVTIAALAMLLAVASLGGENATKETINNNILASDTWAFYQAKNIRQTSFRLAQEELELLAPSLPAEQRAAAQGRIDSYKATVARYESEPDKDEPDNPLKGEGKVELTRRAQVYEKARDHGQAQDPNFDYSVALFQIAIVLGSVSIVANSRPVLVLALGVGLVAAVLMLNGFLLFMDLPIG